MKSTKPLHKLRQKKLRNNNFKENSESKQSEIDNHLMSGNHSLPSDDLGFINEPSAARCFTDQMVMCSDNRSANGFNEIIFALHDQTMK